LLLSAIDRLLLLAATVELSICRRPVCPVTHNILLETENTFRPLTTLLPPITMREGVASSETTARPDTTKIWRALKALTDMPCQWRPDSGRTTPTDRHRTRIGDAHWAISIGLSAVLWISIPAAASIVAPHAKKERKKTHLFGESYLY